MKPTPVIVPAMALPALRLTAIAATEAAATPTSANVRSPAGLPRIWRSKPTAKLSANASATRPTRSHSCPTAPR